MVSTRVNGRLSISSCLILLASQMGREENAFFSQGQSLLNGCAKQPVRGLPMGRGRGSCGFMRVPDFPVLHKADNENSCKHGNRDYLGNGACHDGNTSFLI